MMAVMYSSDMQSSAYRGSWRIPLYIEPHLPDDLVYHGVVAMIEDDISPTMEWVNFCNDLQAALLSMNISQKEMMESIERDKTHAGKIVRLLIPTRNQYLNRRSNQANISR